MQVSMQLDEAFRAIDNAIQEVTKLRKNLKKKKGLQVRSVEECSLIKSTIYSWLKNHQQKVSSLLSQNGLDRINQLCDQIIQVCDRATSRRTYDTNLKKLSQELTRVKTDIINASTNHKPTSTTDNAPDFSSLTTDVKTQKVLIGRWEECRRCIAGKAPLAATVMMGGLLETLLLSRINKENNKTIIYKSKTAPKNKNGETLQLKDWTLRNYIDVAHELKWISQPAKNVSEILRDYRNYIHPYKQLSHDIEISLDDAILFWEITKSISRQLLSL